MIRKLFSKQTLAAIVMSSCLYACSSQQELSSSAINNQDNKKTSEQVQKELLRNTILSYSGDDTVIFENVKKKVTLTRHQERYVLYTEDKYFDEKFLMETSGLSQEAIANQPSFDIALARSFVDIKNTLKNRDITSSEISYGTIVQELSSPCRLVDYQVRKYVDAVVAVSPTSAVVNELKVHGVAREHLSRLRDTTFVMIEQEKQQERKKENNNNTNNDNCLNALVKELDKQLMEKKQIVVNSNKLFSGVYNAVTADGDSVFVVLAQFVDPKKGVVAREYTGVSAATKTFVRFAFETINKESSKKAKKVRYEIPQNPLPVIFVAKDSIYQIRMVFDFVGKSEHESLLRSHIKEDYQLEEIIPFAVPVRNRYIPQITDDAIIIKKVK